MKSRDSLCASMERSKHFFIFLNAVSSIANCYSKHSRASFSASNSAVSRAFSAEARAMKSRDSLFASMERSKQFFIFLNAASSIAKRYSCYPC